MPGASSGADPAHHSEPATATELTTAITVHVEVRDPAVVDGIVVPRPERPIRLAPVRHALVAVEVPGTDAPLVATTDAAGVLTVPTEATALTVLATGDDAWPIAVFDCPMGGCKDGGAVYAWATPVADTVTIPVTSDVAGAFNIREQFIDGFAFVRASVAIDLPPLRAQWRHGSNTMCNTSCFSGAPVGGTVYVLALDDDSDEHDHDILRHEFGHYVEHVLVGQASRGGYHDGTPTRPDLAFSEGFCTWLATAIDEDPVYVDTNLAGGGWTDYSAHHADADPAAPLSQDLSEDMVAELLWAWFDARGRDAGPILRGLFDHVRDAGVDVRGGPGVDLADALDGIVCDTAGAENAALLAVVERHTWPWHPEGAHCAGTPSAPPRPSTGPSRSPITPSRIALTIDDKGGGSVLVQVQARASFAAATLSWRDPDGALAELPVPVDLGALSGGATARAIATLAPSPAADARVSVHLDGRLVGGARYHMTASVRADGAPWVDPPMVASNLQSMPLDDPPSHASTAWIRAGAPADDENPPATP